MDGSEKFDTQPILILLSGPIASGKSTVAKALISNHEFRLLSSGDYLRAQLKAEGKLATRKELQDFGDQLDIETNYAWLAEKVSVRAFKHTTCARWILDSVRKKEQVQSHKELLGLRVLHVHVTAPAITLKTRYLIRETACSDDYDEIKLHANEQSSESLCDIADLIVDTAKYKKDEICQLIIDFARSKL